MPVLLTDWQTEGLTDRPSDRPTDSQNNMSNTKSNPSFSAESVSRAKKINEKKKTVIARCANINFFFTDFFFARTSPTDFAEKDGLLAVYVVNVGNPFHQLPLSCGASKSHGRQSNYRFL